MITKQPLRAVTCPFFVESVSCRKVIVVFMAMLLNVGRMEAQVSTRSLALGGRVVTERGCGAVFFQPAAAADTCSALQAWVQRGYLLRDLDQVNVTAAFRLSNLGTVSGGLHRFGNDRYSEWCWTATYARGFGKNLRIGIGWETGLIRFGEEYGIRKRMGITAGSQLQLSRVLAAAVAVYKPISERNDDRQRLMLGIACKITPQATIVCDAEQTSANDLLLHAGLEYSLSGKFFLRGGIVPAPFRECFGFAFRWPNWMLELSCAHQQLPGYTPSIAFSYAFHKY